MRSELMYENSSHSVQDDNTRPSPLAMSQDKIIPLPRTKKSPATSQTSLVKGVPMPPPRRVNSHLRFVFDLFHLFCFKLFFFLIVQPIQLIVFSLLLMPLCFPYV